MHFLNVAQCYWHNPDLNAVQLFGKDVRAVLGSRKLPSPSTSPRMCAMHCVATLHDAPHVVTGVACQKVFFAAGHPGAYLYGPIELPGYNFGRSTTDLQASAQPHAADVHVAAPRANTTARLGHMAARVPSSSGVATTLCYAGGRADGRGLRAVRVARQVPRRCLPRHYHWAYLPRVGRALPCYL